MDITPGKEDLTQQKPMNSGEAFLHMFDGIRFRFPVYKHDHPPVININEVADEELTLGQRVADKVASTVGSWPFIITQSCILALWLILNIVGWFKHWDPYPFILLNLALSFQAAYAAPFVMMSQNRQSEKDRLTAQNDYQTDCKGEEEIRVIMEHLDHQDTIMLQIMQRIEAQEASILKHLTKLDPQTAQQLLSDIQQISEELVDGELDMGGNS